MAKTTLKRVHGYLAEFDSASAVYHASEKLREEGAEEKELKKVRAPIGLDIGAVSPEEVAVAILAEIVAERNGGTGTPLSSWRRR